MSAERVQDVEYERDPTYDDVQRLVALLNGSDGHGAPARLTDYRGAAFGLQVRSDGSVAVFEGADGSGLWTIEESGLTGGAPASFDDTLSVAGKTTLADVEVGQLAVSGNATVGGTLGVSGATTLAGLTAQASTLASLAVTTNATVGGTFRVTGGYGFGGVAPALPPVWAPAGSFTTDRNVAPLEQASAIPPAGSLAQAAELDATENLRLDVKQLFDVVNSLLRDLRDRGLLR